MTQDELDRCIASAWTGVLECDQVGADDDFFALGGHSLLAIRVVARLKEDLGLSLPLSDVYLYPRFADLAAHVRSVACAEGTPS